MRDRDELYKRLRHDLDLARQANGSPKAVHLNPQMRKLLEAEWGITHDGDGTMRYGTVPLIADDQVSFGDYVFKN